jgi:hypothetical protein
MRIGEDNDDLYSGYGREDVAPDLDTEGLQYDQEFQVLLSNEKLWRCKCGTLLHDRIVKSFRYRKCVENMLRVQRNFWQGPSVFHCRTN